MSSTPAVNLNNLKQTPIPVVPMTMKIVNQDGTPTRQGQLLLEQLQKTGTGSGGPTCSLVADIPQGTQDSQNPDFTLANQPAGAMILFLNGVDQQLGVDYTLTQTTITYTTPPNPTDWQVAYYDVCSGSGGAGNFWMAGEGGAIYYLGGAVGIGTSTPQAMLDVNGSANFHGNIALGTGGPNSLDLQTTTWNGSAVNAIGSNEFWNGQTWVLRNPAYSGWVLGMDVTRDGSGGFSINYTPPGTSAVITQFYLAENGNIAIGGNNFNPQYALDVTGSVNVTGDFFVNGVPIAAVAAGFWRAAQPTNSGSIWYGGGNVGIGQDAPQYPLDVVGSALIEFNPTDGILYLGDSNHGIKATNNFGLTLFTYGAPQAVVIGQGDGYVGINQPNPLAQLDVNGSIRAIDSVLVGTNTGPTSLVLQSIWYANTGDNTIAANMYWTGTQWQLLNVGYSGWTVGLDTTNNGSGGVSISYTPPNSGVLITNFYMTEQGWIAIGGDSFDPLANLDVSGNVVLGNSQGPGCLDLQATSWKGAFINTIGSNAFWNGAIWQLRNPSYCGWLFGLDAASDGSGGLSIDYMPRGSTTVETYAYMTENGYLALGLNNFSPQYQLDITGDCNVSGTYRINGQPLSSFWLPGTPAGAIYYSGGPVGIGVSNPQAVLDVQGGILANPPSGAPTALVGWCSGVLSFALNTNTDGSWQMDDHASGSWVNSITSRAGYIGIQNTAPLYSLDITGDCNVSGTYRVNGVPFNPGLWTAGANGSIYYNGGNVGIGTSVPQAVLHVQGGILANPPAAAPTAFEAWCGGVQSFALNTATDGSWGLYDYASGNWALSITSRAGRIGIGAANPQGRLEVVDAVGTSSPGFNNQLIIREATDNPAYGLAIGFIPPAGVWCGSLQAIAGNGPTTLLLNPNGGNVGIATETPAAPLDVNGSANFNGYVHIGTGGPGQASSLDIQAYGYAGYAINDIGSNIFWNGSAFQQRYSGFNSWIFGLQCGSNGQSGVGILYFPPGSTNPTEYFALKENGFLGLAGNYNPQHSLDVAGGINCTDAYYRDGVRGAENYFVVPIPGGGTFNVYVNGGIVTGWAENRSARADDPETCDPGDWYTCAPSDRQLVFKMRGKDGILRRAVLNFE